MSAKAEFLERVRAVLSGQVPPVAAHPAATVALVRDGADGLEVYLLRRVRSMTFAAGMHVFPGGRVDLADGLAGLDGAGSAGDAGDADSAGAAIGAGWSGPAPRWWAHRFGTDEASARASVFAAVRETFEESGVLLAGPSPSTVVDDVTGPQWEADRLALESGALSLGELLARNRLILRADLLAPLAHWITPEVEPKRFDTRFFVAALPEGQACRDAGTEADLRLWIRPQDALDRGLHLMPPTQAVLSDLATHPDVNSALHADRQITTVLPRVELTGDHIRFVL